MSLSRTNIGSWATSTYYGTGSYATGSFTPPANSLLVVFVAMMGNSTTGDLGQPTISGGGLTFTFRGRAYGTASWSHRVNVFTAPVGSSPASMTITVDDDNNQNIFNYSIVVMAYTGYDTSTPIAGWIDTGSTNIGDGAESQTLSATPTANDVTLWCTSLDCDNSPTNPTLAAGWTKIYDPAVAYGGATLTVSERTGSTSTTVSITDVYTASGSLYKGALVAFVVKTASAASPVTINCGAGALASSGAAASVSNVPPAVTVACAAGAMSLAGQQADVVPGPVSIGLNTGSVTLSGQQADAQPGAVSVAINSGTLTFAGQLADAQPGAVTIACGAGIISLSGQQADVQPGAVSVGVSAGTSTTSGQNAGVSSPAPGISIACAAGTLSLSGQQADIQPGAVSVGVSSGAVTFAGQGVTVTVGETIINCGAGSISLSGQQSAVQPGAVSLAISTGAITFSGQSASVSTAAPVSVACGVGAITLSGQQADAQPGAVTIACAEGLLDAAGVSLTVVPGATSVSISTGALAVSGQQLSVVAAALISKSTHIYRTQRRESYTTHERSRHQTDRRETDEL